MSYLSVLDWGRTAPPVQSLSSGVSVPTTVPPAAPTTADPPAVQPAQPAHMLTALADHSEVLERNQRKAQAIYDAIDAQTTLNKHTSGSLRNGGKFNELDGAFDALKQLIDDPRTAMTLGTPALVDYLRADQASKLDISGPADAIAAPLSAAPRQLSIVASDPDGQSRHSSPGSSPLDPPPFEPHSDAETNYQAESYMETPAVDDSSDNALEGREGSAPNGIATMTSPNADSDRAPVARSAEEGGSGSSSTKIDSHPVLRPRTETAYSTDKDSTRSLVKPSKAKAKRGISRAPSSSGPARKKRKSNGPSTKLPIGTLAKSDGIARIAGVKWPTRGPHTFEGITKEIQCEACNGRLHWACAGFKDDESVVGRGFKCADCQHLLDTGMRLDLPAHDGDKCVRPSCVRRSHTKIITSPDDVPRYMVEKPLGYGPCQSRAMIWEELLAYVSGSRRIVEPATPTTGAKYEYLIKWWNYPLEESTWEPEASFPVASEIADQFLEAAMDEGVSIKRFKEGVIVLEEAAELCSEA